MCKKFKFSGIFILLILIFSLSAHAHKFYVSLCRIHYIPDSARLQITIKIFTDDLEKVLEQQGAGEEMPGDGRELSATDSALSEYLSRHFRLRIHDKLIPLHFLGKEVSYDVTWCYLESEGVEPFDELTVESDLLTEAFPAQINLVELSVGEEKKGVMLNRDKTKESIILKE